MYSGYIRTKARNGTALTETEGGVKIYDYLNRYYSYTPKDVTVSGRNSGEFQNYDSSAVYCGIMLGGKGIANGTGVLYIDNIRVRTVNTPLSVEVTASNKSAFNTEEDTIIATFTQPMDLTTIQNIYVKDASGNKVEDVVKTVTPTDDNKVLTIKLDASKLVGNTNYDIIFPATLTDIYGQGLVTYYNQFRSSTSAATEGEPWYNTTVPKSSDKLAVSISTTKANKIYIQDVTDGYDVTTGTFSKTLTINNVSSQSLPVWIAAAAYDIRNNLIGYVDIGNAFTLDAGATTTKDLAFTVESGKTAKYIRIFVWNGEDTMMPYQVAEQITIQ